MTLDKIKLIEKIKEVIPQNTVGRYDLLPIFRVVTLFEEIVEFLSTSYHNKVDYVVAPEAIGWILGTAISRKLNVGFIPVRKGDKLPYPKNDLLSISFVDYSGEQKSFEIPKNEIIDNERILIVDEWIETGTQIKGIIKMFENCDVVGIATIGIDYNESTQNWIETNFVTYVGTDI